MMGSSSLVTLGTVAGPKARADRAQSSNLLTVNGVHYVIDAGDGVARRLAEAGVELRDIGTVFLTHHHDDHTAGLGTLMSLAWDRQRTQPIHVYGPPPTVALVQAAIAYYGISAEIRIADGGRKTPIDQVFTGHDIGTGRIYEDANVRVTAVENTHFAFHSGAAAAGDTGPSEALTELAAGADLLLTETSSLEDRRQAMLADGRWAAMSEAQRTGIMEQAARGHMTLERIGRMATEARVKTVVLTHLTRRFGSDDYGPWADEVGRLFSGTVIVAHDLMRL
jgi:ribonuclease BN (tRNA processing enzyme)